jgi:hypothetical protein
MWFNHKYFNNLNSINFENVAWVKFENVDVETSAICQSQIWLGL